MDPDESIPEAQPSAFNYVLSFLLVGVAWGFTTPFIRRAAADFNARQEKQTANTTSRGRSHTNSSNQSPSPDAGVEQELLERDDEIQDEGVRRRSASRQREEERRASADAGVAQEVDVDDAPAPAWMQSNRRSWLRTKIVSVFWTVVNLLRTPAYSIPLVINLTGSIWFFLLVGKHELSLTVPLANSSAFLFTVLGEWYVDRKVIAKETWLGLILVLGGIALCVHSKNQTG
ncbi:hypothetical protein N7532_001680 [Penicillium argentinense]|uniref:Integral membrane protein n=1 Tax=Penicillium argentinense TaxID=1131581 RepID=A0A9W9G2Y2_9EURO|nr:uncharacterized protein N7532_001680 [Penicillium argentinense]KAJ5111145.1 hypothetical protein N7532_001680 [Penicillium argentinense]